MVRVLYFLVVLIALALGLVWLIERPGEVTLSWQGYRIETSFLVGLGVLLAVVAAFLAIWNILRFAFRYPPAKSVANQARRREKGYAAISQGIIAVGTGDARLAGKAAAEVQRLLPDEPLALLLRAEAAQLAGDHRAVEAAFKEMTRSERTRLLGLRGLHAHAHRRGQLELAHHFASAAHDIAALPWSAAAVLERHVAAKDWQNALAVLESNGNLIDKTTRDRQRAVLTTAIALGKEQTAPDEALRLALSAVKRAPDLVPAVALAARLLARGGGVRKAAKMIEAAWPLAPHPELANLYLDLRPADSSTDRLARARILAKLSPRDPESRMALASAAITACDYESAREAMLPLIEGDERPTSRMCLLMADIEEAEHGETGYAREWLARASRAPRDPCWIADGVMSEQWLPASPATGKLDAFVWRRPDERPSAGGEPDEAIFRPIAAPAEPTLLIEKPQTTAITASEDQAGPEPAVAASRAMTGEGASAEAFPGEADEQGPPVAGAPSMAAYDPVPDQLPKPRWLRRLFRAVALGRKAAPTKDGDSDMVREGASAEASPGEANEQGPPVAGAPSMAAYDPVPEQMPKPRWLSRLFRAVALVRKAAATKDGDSDVVREGASAEAFPGEADEQGPPVAGAPSMAAYDPVPDQMPKSRWLRRLFRAGALGRKAAPTKDGDSDMVREGASAEAFPGEADEQGPPVAGAPSMAAYDPVPDQMPKPRWLRRLFRAVALGRKAAPTKDGEIAVKGARPGNRRKNRRGK